MFSLIHGGIGMFHQSVRVAAIGGEKGDTDAGRDEDFVLFDSQGHG